MRYKAIQKRIQNIKNPLAVEIGVYKADFSYQILKNIPEIKLVMIDPWSADTYKGKTEESASLAFQEIYQDETKNSPLIARKRVKEFTGRYNIIQDDSVQSAKRFLNKHFDIVFLDAGHSYEDVKADCNAWIKKVKSGGYIGGHDYLEWQGVKKAVDEIFGDKVELDVDDTWWVQL